MEVYMFAATLINLSISVIGTGYVGLVTGTGLAQLGHNVIGADIDKQKITLLQDGIIPFYEPGLKELVTKHSSTGTLTFTSDVSAAIKQSDVIIIAVGTPMDPEGKADLSAVYAVAKTIAHNLNGHKYIVTKSTVPVGTGKKLKQLIQDQAPHGATFDIISNPEFLREGSSVQDFLKPDRIVVGCESLAAQKIMQQMYAPVIQAQCPLVTTNIETAETIKYAANAFLAVKLTFINELSRLCDASGANVLQVAHAMGLDHRISPHFLQPGPGFGGSCFPKDSRALIHIAKEYGVSVDVVAASITANEQQKKYIAHKVLKTLGTNRSNKTVAILGLAFKAHTDDIRSTQALDIIRHLRQQGIHIKAYDPMAMENMKKNITSIEYCTTAYDAVTDADAVLILTEWPEFCQLDYDTVHTLMRTPLIIDSRNLLDAHKMGKKGFILHQLGTHPHTQL